MFLKSFDRFLVKNLSLFFKPNFLNSNGVPKGSRTPVNDVRGRCPRPLDDGNLEFLYFNTNYLCGLLEAGFIIKEVIQPQVPLWLPCYDFTPVINHTVVTALN